MSTDLIRAEDGRSWTATRTWPPAGTHATRYYLTSGPSGTIASSNDGQLLSQAPAASAGADVYEIDYTASGGSFTRWTNSYGARRADPKGTTFFDERTTEEKKGLTYTSEPVPLDTVIVGSPVIRLWVSSTHADGDVFAWLSEVDAAGRSHYVTEGVLRASHRALHLAPFANFGLPHHRSFAADVVPLVAGEPAELVFELMGTAVRIDAGHRLRVTITGASARDFALHPDPEGRDRPSVTVHRSAASPSRIEVPVVGGLPPR